MKNTRLENIMSQLEGLSYRQAIWLLECVKSKIEDYSVVGSEYIRPIPREFPLEPENNT